MPRTVSGLILDRSSSEPRGPGLRFDSGVTAGSQVSHYYDQLLAKLIVQAENRPAAIRRMQAALRELVLHGLTSNVDFLQTLLAHPDFQAGQVTTRWVETTFADWQPDAGPPLAALLAAALSESAPARPSPALPPPGRDPYSPWKIPGGFRLGTKH